MNEFGRYDTTALLERALPVVEGSHRILANNIANANTPGFRPTHVSFRESLKEALAGTRPGLSLETTHMRHISTCQRRPALGCEKDTFEPGRTDLSTFDVDREMVELSKNNSRFNILSAMLTKRYQQMREVLRIP